MFLTSKKDTKTGLSTNLSALKKKVPNNLLTIRWTLPLCVVTPLVVGISLTGWLSFRSGQSAVDDLVGEISTEVAANIEKQVASYLKKPTLVSNAVAVEVEGNNLAPENIRTLGQSLWQLTRSELLVNNLYYGNESGELVYSENQNGEARLDFVDAETNFKRIAYDIDDLGNLGNRETLNDYDPRVRPWYQKAAADRTAGWSPVYVANSRDDLTLTRVTPILDDSDRLQGVFGIDVYLNELSDFMRSLDISSNGKAFIMEPSGELVAISSQEKPFVETGSIKQRMAAIDSLDPLVSATVSNLQKNRSDLNSIEGQYAFEFELEDETQMAYIYRIQSVGIDWIVGITIPQNDYMGTIQEHARYTWIMGVAIAAAASLLSLAAAMHIVRPINQLNQAAYDIQNNQFDPAHLSSVIGRFDEFSDLAILFNDMATVVVSREQSLAEQVNLLKTEIHRSHESPQRDRQKIEAILERSKQLRKTLQAAQS